MNGDGRVEYSELAAFLTAANYAIQDPRARLRTIVKPPASSMHAALSDLRHVGARGRLTDIPASVGRFFVEDDRGTRLVDGHAETGFAMSVILPAGQPLFVRDGDREAELQLKSAEERSYGGLSFRPRAARARGALETSLRAGVFATPYGPAYYRGYLGQTDAVLISFPQLAVQANRVDLPAPPIEAPPTPHRRLRWVLAGMSGALLASAAVFGGLAWDARRDFDRTSYPAQASDAADRYHRNSIAACTLLLSGLVFGGAYFLQEVPAHTPPSFAE